MSEYPDKSEYLEAGSPGGMWLPTPQGQGVSAPEPGRVVAQGASAQEMPSPGGRARPRSLLWSHRALGAR